LKNEENTEEFNGSKSKEQWNIAKNIE